MKTDRKTLILTALLICVFCICFPSAAAKAKPAFIKALSCSQQDVQKAIDSATDGDTVLVPAGTATWTTLVKTHPAVRISKKGITLKGAGIGKTVITNRTNDGFGKIMLIIDGVEGKFFRVTGFTFRGMGRLESTHAAIQVGGTCRSWRIDNCGFDATGTRGTGVRVHDNAYGLVDHCIFVNCQIGVRVFGDGAESWKRPLTLGTADAVYVEHCLFNHNKGGMALVALGGARYVFRHNKVTSMNVEHSGCSSAYRGTFSFEIYRNVMNGLKKRPWPMGLNGGTGVIFDNIFTRYEHGISVTNYRSGHTYKKWGTCDGKNPLDGNQDPSGYPALDQIGRSTNQKLEPLFEWNNKLNGANADINIRILPNCQRIRQHIKENRDFYNDTKRPNYKPFTYPHPLGDLRKVKEQQ